MSDANTIFRNRLNRLRYCWSGALWSQWLLVLLACVLVAFLVLGFGDFLYAFSPKVRLGMMVGIAGVFAMGLVITLLRSRQSAEQTARRVDDLRGDARRLCLSTLELSQVTVENERPMAAYLREQSIASGWDHAFGGVNAKQWWPWRQLGKAALWLAAAGILVALPFLFHPEAAKVVAQRMLLPNRDIAPWSPLKFSLSSASSEVVYGEGMELQVTITGGEIEQDPVCVLEGIDGLREVPCYKLGDGRYRISLDSVTESLRLACKTGRARSAWHPVEVLLKPKILQAELSLTPPSYVGQPAQHGELPAEGVSGLVGSHAVLELESNRPVGGGTLSLINADGDVLQRIEAETVGQKRIAFRWDLLQPGLLRAELRDVRGTPVGVEFSQQVKLDEAPQVALTSPPSLMLATPDSHIPVTGEARDDFSLGRIDLVRTLVGYRDRPENLTRGLEKVEFDFQQEMDLSKLGVEPGQTLEFYLEATDMNPVLTGVGTSELVKVVVISHNDYAERIRTQTTLREFEEKFQALSHELDTAKKSLEKLEKAIKDGDPKAIEEARKQAEQAHQKAAELFRKIEKDFPAFDLEKQLGPSAKKLADALEQNQKDLGQLPQEGDKPAAVQQMRKRLGDEAKDFEQLADVAKDVAEVGKIQQMASELQQIYEAQKSLAQRMGEIADQAAKGNLANLVHLQKLADNQRRIQARLKKFRDDLAKRSSELPEQFADLAKDIDAFLYRMDEANIPPVMAEAERHAQGQRPMKATSQALLAEGLLRQLMDHDPQNKMCQMCQGQGGECQGMGQCAGAGETLQQMLDAMMKRGGAGMGPGMGKGGGGRAGTGAGFAMENQGLNIPMSGPGRMRFQSMGQGQGNSGHGAGAGSQARTAAGSHLGAGEDRAGESSKLDLEQVPSQYRDAVKRYFTQPDKPADAPNQQ